MWQAITQQLSDTLMFEYQLVEKVRLSGGDISESYMINDGEQRYFVKINEREFLPKFEAEAESLHLMRETSTVFVPEVVDIGKTKTHAFLILNYLPTKPLEDSVNSFEFGQQLAKLHLWGEQKEFGFDTDNYIGSTLQPNQWHKKWAVFFAEQRIGWQLQLLKEKGVTLVDDIDDFIDVVKGHLSGHSVTPSLLHGDLWNGNAALTAVGPICFDPACYWGDRECDIAMTELFGGFHPDFYAGYESVAPLSASYVERREIYNLYHILNHCNLFGGHYLEQAQGMVTRVLSY
ncbi:fructosamine kinase family protein [Vibrio sp. CAU 1672]|uniref:fructosamine kinase family protein n=1 Tax=Vibrio sp. CAU 1672 TaxID=3032594 RepID=UPI0023DABBDA|nr:fructosamine kinase family protein [Vibrio sp. CAU 1672]MDF2152171.1 fructosamine kinase family protein [Vibrio sp. CAU 1672]